MKGCEFQMKMKSVKAVLIFLLLLAGMVTGYLLWSMREPEYEKEGMLVENEVTDMEADVDVLEQMMRMEGLK